MKTYIAVEGVDISRPAGRPPKSGWKIELIKKGLNLLQHASARKSAEIIWHYFTLPGKAHFSESQLAIMSRAEISQTNYKGDMIKSYRWGTSGPKVLLCHGWRSKTADFRKMIDAFLTAGYVVEGLDLRAHGQSEGKHTAIPEYRDILKNHMIKNGPYQAVVGYSIGALASGIVLSEMGTAFHPKHFFVIAGPPFIRYFFKDIIEDVGCNHAVYEAMCDLLKEKHGQPVDYFDLRIKESAFKGTSAHLIYCEDDQIIPFDKGLNLEECWPKASFVHTKGLGHYKIIASQPVIDYLITQTGS